MSSDGKTLYIGGSTGVYVVNAQTDSLLSTLNLGYPNSLAFSPNDSLACALHSPYPTVVDVSNTATYQDLGQFAVAGQSFLMDVDTSWRHVNLPLPLPLSFFRSHGSDRIRHSASEPCKKQAAGRQ